MTEGGVAGAARCCSAAVLRPARTPRTRQFQNFLQSLWPEAQRMGVSRATFDAAIRGLEPDLSLPDLALAGRPERPPPQQPEFVQTPADYVRESSIARLAAEGKKLLAAHRATLDAIEQQFGVPPQIILAIWGRETAFGGYKLPHDALRVLATQAYTGRRKDMFRARIPRGAEDAAGRRAARADAQLLGRRDGADPVPAVGILQARGRLRRRRQASISGRRSPMRWRRRPSSSPTRAGCAASAGPTRSAVRATSIAPSPSRRT